MLNVCGRIPSIATTPIANTTIAIIDSTMLNARLERLLVRIDPHRHGLLTALTRVEIVLNYSCVGSVTARPDVLWKYGT
jgi:hypothetical protein